VPRGRDYYRYQQQQGGMAGDEVGEWEQEGAVSELSRSDEAQSGEDESDEDVAPVRKPTAHRPDLGIVHFGLSTLLLLPILYGV